MTSTTDQPLDRIALVPGAEQRYLILDIAKRVQQEHGSEIHLFCANQVQYDFYNTHADREIFSSISRINLLEDLFREELDEEAVVAEARSFERKLGASYNTIIMTNRHFGRGYSPGGFRHPKSRQSQNTSYLQILDAYNRHFAFWEKALGEKRITAVVGGTKEVASAARMAGLPFRTLVGSRYLNFHYWAENEYFQNSRIETAFQAHEGEAADVSLTQAYLVEQVHQKRFKGYLGYTGLAKQLAHRLALRVYWILKKSPKAKGYYASEEFKFIYARWHDTRQMARMAHLRLSDVEGETFVFYPLHTEPEISVSQLSPEYFCQLAAITSLSRDLPAGVKLAVKETIHGVGRRPQDFYDQIAELKNVFFLDMNEPGLNVVHKAAATATITGTAGFEAAVIGKPVISFGHHNNYNFLDHVHCVTGETDIARHMRTIFDGGFDAEKARQDGARYLQAVVDTSIDLAEYDYIKLQTYSEQVVADAAMLLARTLDADGDADGDLGRAAE